MMADFLAMGHYGGYVWSAYGVAALVLAALVGTSIQSLRARTRDLALLQEAREAVRRKRETSDDA